MEQLTTNTSGWKPVPRILGGLIMTIAKRSSTIGSTDHGKIFKKFKVHVIGNDLLMPIDTHLGGQKKKFRSQMQKKQLASKNTNLRYLIRNGETFKRNSEMLAKKFIK